MKKIALVGLVFPVLLASVPVVALPAVQHAVTAVGKSHKVSKTAKVSTASKTSKTSKLHKLQPHLKISSPSHHHHQPREQGLSSLLGDLMGTGCSTGGAMCFQLYPPGACGTPSFRGTHGAGTRLLLSAVKEMLSSTQCQQPLDGPTT